MMLSIYCNGQVTVLIGNNGHAGEKVVELEHFFTAFAIQTLPSKLMSSEQVSYSFKHKKYSYESNGAHAMVVPHTYT